MNCQKVRPPHRRHLLPSGQSQRSAAWWRQTRRSGLQEQVSADKKHVVLHLWHWRSSSGSSSKTSCSEDSTPCRLEATRANNLNWYIMQQVSNLKEEGLGLGFLFSG